MAAPSRVKKTDRGKRVGKVAVAVNSLVDCSAQQRLLPLLLSNCRADDGPSHLVRLFPRAVHDDRDRTRLIAGLHESNDF